MKSTPCVILPAALLFFSLFGLPVPLCAATLSEDLVINAATVSYDKDLNLIEASGSVEATYKNLMILADRLTYDTTEKKVTVDSGFHLFSGELLIRGRKLDYFVVKGEGEAREVVVRYNGVYLDGERVSLSKNKVDLFGASFDSCGQHPPHYHISANEIVLYPDIKWVISYWGFFWFDRFPLIPIPTYLYDLKTEERVQRNAPPVPEIGSNSEDGYYISERLAWHATKNWNGCIYFNYFEKKGLGGGVEGNYRLDDATEGNVRIFGNAVDQWYGGVTHHVYFGREVNETDSAGSSSDFFFVPRGRRFNFQADLSFRERINYQKISYCPKLSLNSKRVPWLFDRLQWDFAVAGGSEREESIDLGVGFANFNLGTYYEIPLAFGGTLTPSISFDHRLYGNGTYWQKALEALEYRCTLFNTLGMVLAQKHYLYNLGESPFNFEKYWFEARDEVDAQWLMKLGDHKVEIKTAHYLPTLEPKDIDYVFALGFHCYDIILTYRAMRHEVTFGADLVSR